MAIKKSESSQLVKRTPVRDRSTDPITEEHLRQAKRLAKLPDSEIDFSDIPAMTTMPSEIFIGKFYRPVKQSVSVRLDADVLAWFRSQGKKYQSHINQVLRREMLEAHSKR